MHNDKFETVTKQKKDPKLLKFLKYHIFLKSFDKGFTSALKNLEKIKFRLEVESSSEVAMLV